MLSRLPHSSRALKGTNCSVCTLRGNIAAATRTRRGSEEKEVGGIWVFNCRMYPLGHVEIRHENDRDPSSCVTQYTNDISWRFKASEQTYVELHVS